MGGRAGKSRGTALTRRFAMLAQRDARSARYSLSEILAQRDTRWAREAASRVAVRPVAAARAAGWRASSGVTWGVLVSRAARMGQQSKVIPAPSGPPWE